MIKKTPKKKPNSLHDKLKSYILIGLGMPSNFGGVEVKKVGDASYRINVLVYNKEKTDMESLVKTVSRPYCYYVRLDTNEEIKSCDPPLERRFK